LRLVKPIISRVIFDCERGARTTLHLALSDALSGARGSISTKIRRRRRRRRWPTIEPCRTVCGR
jgi:hypothetical protein